MLTPDLPSPSRRDFLRHSTLAGSALMLPATAATADPLPPLPNTVIPPGSDLFATLDLAPARWVWYPSARVLQNTMVLFRKVITIDRKPTKATGWLMADSRYELTLNGQRTQWGPAPSDPRWAEADPVDLTSQLQTGPNVLGIQVLFYGQGDGTWPAGKGGLLFKLTLEFADGTRQYIVSDGSWQSHLARSWQPGHYKRWYLRAFQEEFDARLYPTGWNTTAFQLGADWHRAMLLVGRADKPAIATNLDEYQSNVSSNAEGTALRRRSIPLLAENRVLVKGLAESLWVRWKKPAHEYFDLVAPDAFEVDRRAAAQLAGTGTWRVTPQAGLSPVLTFELSEQVVGWPQFTIDAPAGTIVELMVQESHQMGGPALLNTHFHSWTRFVCKEGVNTFQTFDYESFRWLQLHIHEPAGPVTISNVGVLRRQFPWPQQPGINCADAKIQKVLEASINTLHNSAQDIIVDGMGRERQQYSGDCGHQLHTLFHAFGETRLPARFCNTYSQGLTFDGYFLDSWPAYDRLARLAQRQLGLTPWGPILDHSVGFVFDCYHYYQHTGDRTALAEAFPRLLRFLTYLKTLRTAADPKDTFAGTLLPVENLGIPTVWIDHDAYKQQRHKQCAFNLYAAAMAEHALPVLCRVFGEEAWAKQAEAFGKSLREAVVTRFWDAGQQLFVVNKPWLANEKAPRTCDRSLATAMLYNQFPKGASATNALRTLADVPESMGLSYPANAIWRFWGLAKGGRMDVVLNDLRTRWHGMASVQQNNTLQEMWDVKPDSGNQWSHCPIGPLVILYQGVAGIEPIMPGFRQCRIRPQFSTLESIQFPAHTPKGPIQFNATGTLGNRTLTIQLPPDCDALLELDPRETVSLTRFDQKLRDGRAVYSLKGGQSVTMALRFT